MNTLKTIGMVTLLGVVVAMSSTVQAKKDRTKWWVPARLSM